MINLTPESRSALHELLDISLNSVTLNKLEDIGPTVMLSVAAHCGVVQADIHLDGWSQGRQSDKNVWISLDPSLGSDAAEKGLAKTKECLAAHKPKTVEQLRSERISKLRAQLEKEESEGKPIESATRESAPCDYEEERSPERIAYLEGRA